MSRFYQRYISSTKKAPEEAKDQVRENRSASQSAIDPTSGAKSQSARPMSTSAKGVPASVGGSSSAASTGAGAGGPARRVQIYNSSDAYSPDTARKLTVYAKPASSRAFLRSSLSVHYLFETLGDEDMERIIDCMRPLKAADQEVVIRQGDMGDLFYCLESGSAEASVSGVGVVMTYAPGGCFGELALIYNTARAASVTATTACRLWALDLR